MVELSDSGDVQLIVDENNRDVFIGRRLEVFFTQNEDGTPSANGKLLWHTEWWHMTGNVVRGKSIGPQIERTIEQVLAGDFGGIAGVERHDHVDVRIGKCVPRHVRDLEHPNRNIQHHHQNGDADDISSAHPSN